MKRTIFATAAAATLLTAPGAFAQEAFLGQLMLVGFNFCPRGWATADGQILSIAQNTALFSLFGTTYGGNGQTTFALPDLRGRVPMHTGQGPGLPAVTQGEIVGTPATTLTISQMPAHSHTLKGTTGDPDWRFPNGNTFANFPGTSPPMYSDDLNNVDMKSTSIASTGGSQPFQQYQPSLVLLWCVALEGIYPSRN